MINDEINNLFIVNPEKPMKFIILKDNMLNVKYNQLSKKIKRHGGVLTDYDAKDECIILTQKFKDDGKLTHLPTHTNYNIFDIKYIKDCMKKKRILNLQDYIITGPSRRVNSLENEKENRIHSDEETSTMDYQEIDQCPFAKKILSNKKCPHMTNRSAATDLQLILKL